MWIKKLFDAISCKIWIFVKRYYLKKVNSMSVGRILFQDFSRMFLKGGKCVEINYSKLRKQHFFLKISEPKWVFAPPSPFRRLWSTAVFSKLHTKTLITCVVGSFTYVPHFLWLNEHKNSYLRKGNMFWNKWKKLVFIPTEWILAFKSEGNVH